MENGADRAARFRRALESWASASLVKTYAIETDASGRESIFCRLCHMRSYHHKDIETLYCGRCHDFHNHLALVAAIETLQKKL